MQTVQCPKMSSRASKSDIYVKPLFPATNKFANDGSFLDMFKKQLSEQNTSQKDSTEQPKPNAKADEKASPSRPASKLEDCVQSTNEPLSTKDFATLEETEKRELVESQTTVAKKTSLLSVVRFRPASLLLTKDFYT